MGKNAGGLGPLKNEDALAFLQRADSASGASVYEHLTSVVQEVRRRPPALTQDINKFGNHPTQ